MNWFHYFKDSILNESKASDDLIGANGSLAEVSLEHYRFQHQQKIKEAVEATYPILVKKLGSEWNMAWNNFWGSRPHSPRSLDFYPDVFLDYFQNQDAPLALKELAFFERAIDTYSWNHVPIKACSIAEISASSIIELTDYDILEFRTPVIDSFNELPLEKIETKKYHTMIWITHDGVEFRYLEYWELSLLKKLNEGIGIALEGLDRSEEEVISFFRWLAGAGLILKIES